jgi:predicted Zn finger-like uncharacterized protein
MKIVCPSCHLTGNINEADIPPQGRRIACPKCRAGLFIHKPAPGTDDGYMMGMCPVCGYSTFTDEMFSECPTCGTNGADYRKMLLSKQSGAPQGRGHGTGCCEESPEVPDSAKIQQDLESLTRSRRNPDFGKEPPPSDIAKKSTLPLPVRVTAWSCVAVGAAFFLYGLAGLSAYYGKDWQAVLSVPLLEPVSRVQVFFRVGLFPWMRTLFGTCFILAATCFFARHPRAPRALVGLCLGGIGLMLLQEAVGIVNRVIITSGSPSLLFYLDCLISFTVTVLLWSSPFLALIWLLRRDETLREHPPPRTSPMSS